MHHRRRPTPLYFAALIRAAESLDIDVVVSVARGRRRCDCFWSLLDARRRLPLDNLRSRCSYRSQSDVRKAIDRTT